ncbi:Interactor of constitutive active ROPs 3-like protein [Drosera capensis]
MARLTNGTLRSHSGLILTLSLFSLKTQEQDEGGAWHTSIHIAIHSRFNFSRTSSSEAPPKVSPRVARPLKLNPPEFSTSPALGNRTPKDRSPKVSDRRSPRSPRKRPSRVSELESQILQLQEDLKNVKNQLAASESSKKDAQYNAEELKKELQTVASKFDESQKQLSVLFASKEAHDIELQSISEEKDQAWKSQLEAVKKQYLIDSTALASAHDEIQRLKLQLDMVAESEDAQGQSMESIDAELHILRQKLAETVSLVEITRNELIGCKESEARAREMAQETLLQLEEAKEILHALRLDDMKAKEAINSISSELDPSRSRVTSLESLIKRLKSDDTSNPDDDQPAKEGAVENHDIAEAEQLEIELKVVKSEVGRLKSALEAAEMGYNEEQARRSGEVRSAGELLEHIKSSSRLREAELEEELKKAKEDIEELRANLLDKETALQGISEENEGLNMKLEKSVSHVKIDHELEKELGKLKVDIEELKANLMDKETELQNILEENAILKIESMGRETDRSTDNAVSEVEASRAAEQEALAKLSQVMEDADKSNRKASRVSEQLEAAEAVNSEMESELSRLKVQADQWRKAAEAAASMLSAGNNGKLEGNMSPIAGRISSSYLDDYDDDSPKKKNGNVLKKFGVLWKKPQKP